MFKLNGKWRLKLAIGGWGRGQCFYNAKPGHPGEPAWKNQWSHFAGVGDAKSIKVFYNGKLRNQLDHEGDIGHTDFEWRIGSNAEMPLNRTPAGVIDEVMIFSGDVSGQEIYEIYQRHQQ